jgi:hypothetical protein
LDVSADGLGNVYISGRTYDTVLGPINDRDAFVRKYDAAGNLQWSKQLGISGESQFDESNGVSADALGNVYISGYTNGSLGGQSAGSTDAFVSKYDAAGNLHWTRQLGTATDEISNGVSADGLGNAYIAGWTAGSLGKPNAGGADAFVSKYDVAGNLLWTRQIGTFHRDENHAVSADALGNVFVSGSTVASLGGASAGDEDAFIARYSSRIIPEPASWLVAALAGAGILCIALSRNPRTDH